MKRGIVFLFGMLIAAHALAGEPCLQWSTDVKPAAEPIEVDGRTVVFPAGDGKRIDLADEESASVSDDGRVCLKYDRRTREARVFDGAGVQTGRFTTDKTFAALEISSAGLIVVHHAVAMGMPGVLDVRLYKPDGTLIQDLTGPFVGTGPLRVQFSPDGHLLALLGTGPISPKGYQPMAVVVRGKEEVLSQKMEVGYQPADICFSRDRIAFAVTQALPDERRVLNQVHVYDAASRSWTAIACEDVGMALDQCTTALSDDGRMLFVCGEGVLDAYDTRTAKRAWRQVCAHLDTGSIPVGQGFYLSVVGRYVVAAHLVPTGKGYRYLISVFDVNGGAVNLFDMDLDDRMIKTHNFLTSEQPVPVKGFRVWKVDPDGRSITLNLVPKQHIELPSESEERAR